MSDATSPTSISFKLVSTLKIRDLIGQGLFAGVITAENGTPCAVVLIATRVGSTLTWDQAMEWAKNLGGMLPSQPVAAMLFQNMREHFNRMEGSYWTSSSSIINSKLAWTQTFFDGYQEDVPKDSSQRHVCAVRLIPLGL